MKSSGIGGQAVLEGVMMKNKTKYAVAVRKPDGEIAVEQGEHNSIMNKCKFFKLPIIRGVVSFVESMVLGVKMLTSSAAYFDEEEVKPGKFELWLQKKFGEKADKFIMGFTVFVSIVMALAIFMLLPLVVVSFIDEKVVPYEWKALIEGVLRVLIFLSYVVLISRMKDIRRVYMYHGAEHKTINCIEHGMAPTVENVRKCSRLHKRCGTSFLLFVMLISVVFFLVVRVETLWLRFVVRILFVPVIAGVSYEFIRLAGSTESKIIGVLSKPGLWLQGMTTKEPDDDMILVAVASVEAVFDWQAYLDENFGENSAQKQGKKSKKEEKKQAAPEVVPEIAAAEASAELKTPAKRGRKKEVVAEEAPVAVPLIAEEAKTEAVPAEEVPVEPKTPAKRGRKKAVVAEEPPVVEAPVAEEAKKEEVPAAEAPAEPKTPAKRGRKKAVVAEETPVAEAPVAEIAPNVEKTSKKVTPVAEEIPVTAAPAEEKHEEVDLASKFDFSFTPAKKVAEPDEETAKASRKRLAAKVSAADKAEEAGKGKSRIATPITRYDEDEEEEDEILRALDKYFVFEGEGTVMERSGDK